MFYLMIFCYLATVLFFPLQALAENSTAIPTSSKNLNLETQDASVFTEPQNIFFRHLDEIQNQIPSNVIFRWPTSNRLTGNFFSSQSSSSLQVIPTASRNGLTVVLELCRPDLNDCISGNFSVDPIDTPSSQALLQQHQSIGYPVTLSPSIEAFFREYQMQDAFYASIAWEQDEQLYTIQFPIAEKQNVLYMALSMVNGQPVQLGQVPNITVRSQESTIIIEGSQHQQESESAEFRDCLSFEQPREVENYPNIRVVGNTAFSDEEIAEAATTLIKPSGVPDDLSEDIETGIRQLYFNDGYLTSKSYVRYDPGLQSYIISIVEGELIDVNIRDNQDVNELYIRDRIRLGADIPLNLNRLEDQLRLLRLDPLFENVSATLREADCPGEHILTVNVIEANRFRYRAELNNYSPPSIGSERFGINLQYLNLTGGGDQVFAGYYRSSTGGLSSFELGYQLPVNPIGGVVSFGLTHTETEVTEAPFDALGIQGESDQYRIAWRQPFVRTPREEFALSVGFTRKEGQTFLFDRLPTPFGFGPNENGFSSTSVFHFGQHYIHRDPFGAWSLSSRFNLGTDLFDATQNPDPTPDGQFFSWLSQVQRVQRLGQNHLLIMQADLQLTPDSLLPSESFVIGGAQSVRGYSQSARSGDNGFRFFIEDRITLDRDGAGRPIFLITPFVDVGAVWNHPDNPNLLPRQTFLAGAGLGIIFQNVVGLEGLNIRLDYGLPLIDLDDRGDNLQDHGFYFSIDYGTD